jgi:hypothetical protein
MHSLHVVLVCALLAFIATGSAEERHPAWAWQTDPVCRQDGDAEGAKLAVELCTSIKVGNLM